MEETQPATVKSKPDGIDTLAVDADIIAYICSALNEELTEPDTFESIDEFIYQLSRDTEVTKMCLFMSPAKNFRYDVAKTRPYKETRHKCAYWIDNKCHVHTDCKWYPTFFGNKCPDYYSKSPRPKHIESAKAYIREIYDAVILPAYEADDCIASYITSYKNAAHAGRDKDIRQVEGWHYEFIKKVWEYTSSDESILKIYRQICTGDSTDSIPGIPGVGAKKAEQAIWNPKTAKQDMEILYYKNSVKIAALLGGVATQTDIQEYIAEQTKLVTLVTKLKIPYDRYVVINPPPLFEDKYESGDFIGLASETIFSNLSTK